MHTLLTMLWSLEGSTGVEHMASHCRECGRPLVATPGKVEPEFCPRDLRPCRNKFTNRRRERGAILYDIIMNARFDRDRTMTETERLVLENIEHWRSEDREERDGRPSWNQPPKDEK